MFITLFENICPADTQPRSNAGLFYCPQNTQNPRKNDYKYMRIITNDLYALLVKVLAQDEKVAVFQQLILSQKAELTEIAPAENKPNEITVNSEVK